VIASGIFGKGASVSIEIDGDGLRKAIVHTFNGRGGIIVGGANTDNITATVKGGDSNTSIDVAVTAL